MCLEGSSFILDYWYSLVTIYFYSVFNPEQYVGGKLSINDDNAENIHISFGGVSLSCFIS